MIPRLFTPIVLLPFFLPSCSSPPVVMPSVGERRMAAVKDLVEKKGYHYTVEQLAAMPEGVTVPFINDEHPEQNGTVEFHRYVLPKGRYRLFTNEYSADRSPWPFPEHGVFPLSKGPAKTEIITALVTAPPGEDDPPPYKDRTAVRYSVQTCALQQKGVHPIVYLDEMTQTGTSGSAFVPRGARTAPAGFDARAIPVFNLTWMENGRPSVWLYTWLEPVADGDPGEDALPAMKPHKPGR